MQRGNSHMLNTLFHILTSGNVRNYQMQDTIPGQLSRLATKRFQIWTTHYQIYL